MFKKILMPAMIGASVALTGTAFADAMKDAKTNVHKEAQRPEAHSTLMEERVAAIHRGPSPFLH